MNLDKHRTYRTKRIQQLLPPRQRIHNPAQHLRERLVQGVIVYRREVEIDRYHVDGVVGGVGFGEGVFERVENAVVEGTEGFCVRGRCVISKLSMYFAKTVEMNRGRLPAMLSKSVCSEWNTVHLSTSA